ncbi:protein bicaudal C homolog 1-A-like isoform X2 [Ambystoma mexicanum]|uniref:protein bicaudal C homolog 1-A-like isoform X2 n=1 Tax=Ambystoma mexicanum TaxID=8296 RepID=UPI0037E8C750
MRAPAATTGAAQRPGQRSAAGGGGMSAQEACEGPAADRGQERGLGSGSSAEHLPPPPEEERFRVDRKMLEAMLQNESGLCGEEFFQTVMEETNTEIKWPSKLKIGAKSKKDPYVKVEGKRTDVLEAKKRILAVLETKVNKVTLKMDVPHTEHSHVIGKGGNNIKRVMEDTGCHIHFPDSNRNNNSVEKSNQVSIAGVASSVESARRQIRELQPLTLMFDLPVTRSTQVIPDANAPIFQHISQSFQVTVSFKQHQRFLTTTCSVKGAQGNCAALKKATLLLIELLVGPDVSVIVSTQLDITLQQHLFLIGQNGAHILNIMQATQAQVIFPDPSYMQPKTTLLMQGTIDSIYMAKQQLLDCMPLSLIFDTKEDGEIEPMKIKHVMEELGVLITTKPKPKQTSKSVIIKGLERNVQHMYTARQLLLGLHSIESLETTKIQPEVISSSELLSNHYLNILLQQLSFTTPGMIIPQRAEMPVTVTAPVNKMPVPTKHVPPPGLTVVGEANKVPTHLEHDIPIQSNHTKAFQRSKDLTNALLLKPEREVLQEIPENDDMPLEIDRPKHTQKKNEPELCMESTLSTKQILKDHQYWSSQEPKHLETSEDRTASPSSSDENNTREKLKADYESKKLLATKAMQRKPVVTEVRTPTDTWSGLGFSKSMPAEAIKELHGVNRRRYISYLANNSQVWPKDKMPSASQSRNWRERKEATAETFPSHPSSSQGDHLLSSSNYFESISSNSSNFLSATFQQTTDLPELFSKLGLSKYTDIFQQQEIDFQTFLTLTDEDLRELGISTFGARRKMLMAIADMGKNKRKPVEAASVRASYLEGGASGRLSRIGHSDDPAQSNRW